MHAFIAIMNLGVVIIVINVLCQNVVLMIKITCKYCPNVVM